MPSIRAWPRTIDVLFYPFILDGVALNPKLNQADGMHPNPAGVKIIVARILPLVKKLVASEGEEPLMFKRLLSVGGFTLLSRITGFVRDMLLAWILGKGILSDAFFVAFLFPNYFRAIFGEGTINPAFLPRYAALHAKGEAAGGGDIRQPRLLLADGGAARAAGAGAVVHARDHPACLAPGFADNPRAVRADGRAGAHHLSLSDPDRGGGAAVGHAERHREILGAAAWSNLLNLAMIATLLAWHWFPNAAYAAAWGVLLGGVAQLIFMLWAGAREGLWLRLVLAALDAGDQGILQGLRRGDHRRGQRGDRALIDTMIASFLPTGSRTALYYADRINQLPLGVLGIALGTVLLPEMSARLAQGRPRRIGRGAEPLRGAEPCC